MRYLLHTVVLVAMTVAVTGCERTVTAEGYVVEYPVEKYMRNLPKAYTGHRHVLLKPPVPGAPATAFSTTHVGGADHMSAASMPMDTDYTSHPIPAPQYAAEVSPVSAMPPMTPPGDMSASYAASAPQPLSPMSSSYDSTYSSMPPQVQLTPPSAIITREVDYGREITVYPLDRADAALPYIPPATPMYVPPSNEYKPTRITPAGVNN